jgi:hypothetical protein
MNKAIRWLVSGEERFIDKIDRKKAEEDTRRGSVKKGRIIRNSNGTIRRVMV